LHRTHRRDALPLRCLLSAVAVAIMNSRNEGRNLRCPAPNFEGVDAASSESTVPIATPAGPASISGRPRGKRAPVAPWVNVDAEKLAKNAEDELNVWWRLKDAELLTSLPQFRPYDGSPVDAIDLEAGQFRAFPNERAAQLRGILTTGIHGHLQSVEWDGKPTGLDRFLGNAMAAIENYVYHCRMQPAFDRRKAQKMLKGAARAVAATMHKLNSIYNWPELSQYLQEVYLAAVKLKPVNRTAGTPKNTSPTEAISRGLKEQDSRLASFPTPRAVAADLMKQQAVLAFAAKRVKLESGDYQRNDAAQTLTNELAYAWMCGTGEYPTYSRLNKQSKNLSPFGQLLKNINLNGLVGNERSQNNFRDYALKSVKTMHDMPKDSPALSK
jgi:hypothetical protein